MTWPPIFTIDNERILQLLTGDRFYSSPDAALREAVLNAIDACGRRADRDAIPPQIRVRYDFRARTLTVMDNGVGMDSADFTKLFTCIGASAASLANDTQTPVGEFGIGVISYFMVCDTFDIHSHKANGEPIGLRFDKSMFDGITHAQEIQPERTTTGTTLVLHLKDPTLLTTLQERHPYWFRSVEGLTAETDDGTLVQQGALQSQLRRIEPPVRPLWLERDEIGCPHSLTIWDKLDGKCHIDILYRGVFVQHFEAERLWALRGAIHVDPKRFKPRLNREAFLPGDFDREIISFLEAAHPPALDRALEAFDAELAKAPWNIHKWTSFWLAVPRENSYAAVASRWDDAFWNRKAFILQGDRREVSLADISELARGSVYVTQRSAGKRETKQLLAAAARVLIARGEAVVGGVAGEGGFLQGAGLDPHYSTDRLLVHFRHRLPPISMLNEQVAHTALSQEKVAVLYDGPPLVAMVRMTDSGAPVAVAKNEVWINIDVDKGIRIAEWICTANQGSSGLLRACIEHYPDDLPAVARLLRRSPDMERLLSPVHRRSLRACLQ